MNEAKVYLDNFNCKFEAQDPFLCFLQEQEESPNAAWIKETSKNLRFEALEEGTVVTQLMKENYAMGGKADVIADTMANTRLLLRANEHYYPVRTCAVQSILSRACISGNALSRVSKPELAEILNQCMRTASGDALLRIKNEKISAVHGGDSSEYAILPMPLLFKHTVDYLQDEFPGTKFAGGWYDHSTVTALWELPISNKMLDSYQRTLAAHGKTVSDLRPALRLTSSDIGTSAANLFPMLFKGPDSRSITLGNPLQLVHKGRADITEFDKILHMIFAQYSYGLKKLESLLDIHLQYPENTMLGVMKQIKIPKKLAMPALELFMAQHAGVDQVTAHDVYYGISDILFALERAGASGPKIAQMEENIAKALSVTWPEFDTSIPVNW